MRTFIILLSCLVCCVTAGHYGLAQKLFGSGQQGYAPVGTDQRQRQEFLLDVLLQVQKPLVNNQLVPLGQELVTDSKMYLSPNDEILQQFLRQAENREIIGRNGVYNPVDISNIRQLVGLQRFFVLARDFNVFQRNVVYARLYFNPVMFVDALSLAIRDRPDTQDLMIPPLNEILPQLYYDNYVLTYAQNVDYNNLISQQANIKPSIFDIFGLRRIGSLFQLSKYGLYNPLQQRYGAQRYGIGRFGISSEGRGVYSKENGREYLADSGYVQEKIVVPVEERDTTVLTNDMDLNVAWNNIILDQLVQAVTEGMQGGQQSDVVSNYQQIDQELQDEPSYEYGTGYGESYQAQNNKQYIYEDQSRGINTNGLPQVDVGNPRLLYVGRRHRAGNGGYSAYINPFYQYGYNDQQYDSAYYNSNGLQQGLGRKYIYGDQQYPYSRQQYQRTQYGYTYPEYYYDRQQNQAGQYDYKDNEYSYGRQQNQGSQYGYRSYDQLNQESQYGNKNNGDTYGRQQNQGSQYGYNDNKYSYRTYYGIPYGRQQYQGSQYGYKDQQGSQYGYNSYDQQNQDYQYGYNDNKYSYRTYYGIPYGRQQYQGSQFGYKDQQGSQYGYNSYDQQNQGSQYGYNDNKYSYRTYYGLPYDRQLYQGSQYGYKDQQGSQYGYNSYDQQNQGSQYGYKDQQYYYGGQQNQGAKYSYNYPVYSSSYYSPYGSQQYYYKNYEYQYQPRSQQQDQYQREQQQQIYRVLPYGPQGVVNAYVGDDQVVLERVVRDTRNRGEGGKRYRSNEGKRVSYRNTEQYRELEGLREGIVRSIESTQQLSYSRRGEILLQSIQELAARLNIQRIVETLEGGTYQQQQQGMQLVQQEVEQIIQQIRTLVEQVREEAGISAGSERTLYILADVIGGRIVLEQQQKLSIGVQRILQELQQQIQRILGDQVGQVNEVTPLVLLYGSLRSPITQQTISSLAQLIDDYRQKLEPYTSSQLSGNGDISVQNVQVDPLVTYTEVVDVDLVNLIDLQLLQSNANNLKQIGQKVVARQQRLNYQPFTISVDIESRRQQEVAIRILLAPQIDYNGRRVSLAQNRNNFILIDAYVQQLQLGVNNIQRNSRQFNGYSGEVSTISQIYRQIMTGQKQQQQSGIIRQLPEHLLLPRGSTVNGGLPVQVLVVVTPLTQQAEYLRGDVYPQQISGLGIASVGVDQLPLYYPLDRKIVDEQRFDVPNIRLTETVIQYNGPRDA